MANLKRVRVSWNTGAGGAGLSTFYTLTGDDVTTDLATFFNAIKGGIPIPVSWQIPSSGDVIDSSTGALTGVWGGGTAATINATSATTYAAGTGMYVRWVTPLIRSGRKFQGRTFFCPISTLLYDVSGTIDNTNLATLQSASDTLVATSKLQLWGRPTTPGGSNGVAASITGAIAVDKVTSLRTRRS